MYIYTLAAIYGGLREAAKVLADGGATRIAENIRDFVLNKGVGDHHLVKHVGSRDVDSSLMGVAVPYGLLDPQDGLMHSTVARIEKELRPPPADCALMPLIPTMGAGNGFQLPPGWAGSMPKSENEERPLSCWHGVASQADDQGHLPEQVSHSLNAPEMYASWVERWGPVARPLLWSHAKYLILCQALTART